MIEIRDLRVDYEEHCAVQDLSLGIPDGEVYGLIGPNGAGKTSLFNLVCGVVKPDAGTVLLNGAKLDGLKFHQRVRSGLSRTWQHVRLFPSLPVVDNLLIGTHSYPGERLFNILFGRAQLKAFDDAAREKAWSVLGKIGLSKVADNLVSDLPYGQQKLIGVARALMGDAKCLLLDEPMAGVEGQAYEVMQHVVREVAESGVAVCVVEHNISFVRDLCDEGVFMFAGAIMARGPVAQLIRDPQLTELYFGH